MAKIGLIDVDGGNYPNLALMKISTYHKLKGDTVEWYSIFSDEYDIVYMSKIFTFSQDYKYFINAKRIIKGGTGYRDYISKVPDENVLPDLELYKGFKWYDENFKDTAFGFLTRGCSRNCQWCVVPMKEGKMKIANDIEELLQGKKKIVLMDNNVLASDYGLNQIDKLIELGIKVDFNQGLDARYILKSERIKQQIVNLKWIRYIRLACDSDFMMKLIEKVVIELGDRGIKPYRFFSYVLLTEFESSYKRLKFCKDLGIKPFAQPYRDFNDNYKIPQWQIDMARWCNHTATFQSIDFKHYKARQTEIGKYYFENIKKLEAITF